MPILTSGFSLAKRRQKGALGLRRIDWKAVRNGFSRRIREVFGEKAGRGLTVLHDDTFLVSYPRSGNTWLRFLIANLKSESVSFETIQELVPAIYPESDRDLLQRRRPRVLKSHECFDPKYPRIVYIVRHPVPVARSSFRYLKMQNEIPSDASFGHFISEFVHGLPFPYGTWADHVNSWLSTREQHSNFMLVRYENLRADTYSQFSRIADFIGLDAGPTDLTRAIDQSDISVMKRLEDERRSKSSWLQHADPDIRFVGGQSRKNLADTNLIEMEWAETIARLGYGEREAES